MRHFEDAWPGHSTREPGEHYPTAERSEKEPLLVVCGLEPGDMDHIFSPETLARLNAYRAAHADARAERAAQRLNYTRNRRCKAVPG